MKTYLTQNQLARKLNRDDATVRGKVKAGLLVPDASDLSRRLLLFELSRFTEIEALFPAVKNVPNIVA